MTNDVTGVPTPAATTHADGRELGYGAANARPDSSGDLGASEAAPGKVPMTGGESGVGAYTGGPVTTNSDGDHAGQVHQGYSGPENDNATSTKEATHDRAS